jgi:hypothetical protein
MASETDGQDRSLSGSEMTGRPIGTVPREDRSLSGEDKPTYQVILRHLARLRDGARAVLALFGSHGADDTQPSGAAPAPPASSAGAEATAVVSAAVKTPMELRIERHMRLVDRALEQIHALNPEHQKRNELPQETRALIARKERTIHDIVEAEICYWAATIENSPLSRFDDMERAWIARILRLAQMLGVDPKYQEHFKFVKDWASYEHH